MSTAAKETDREQVLNELEKYYSDKLASVQAKRQGCHTLDYPRPIVIDGAVNLKIDPTRKELIVSWGK